MKGSGKTPTPTKAFPPVRERSRLAGALLLLVGLFPCNLVAEEALVLVATTGPEVDVEALKNEITEIVVARGLTPVSEEVALATRESPDAQELTASAMESLSEAGAAELVVNARIEAGEGDGLLLHVAIFEASTQLFASTTQRATPDTLLTHLASTLSRLLGPGADGADGATVEEEAVDAPVDEDEDEETDEAVPVPVSSELPFIPESDEPPPQLESENRRRVPWVFNSTALGLALMAGVLFAADVNDPRLFAPILLIGGAGGLTTALLVERRWPVSRGDNGLIAVGGWYGLATGVLCAGTTGFDDLRWLMTGALAGEVVGLTVAILTSVYAEVTPGDATLIHSGAIWGAAVGGALAMLVWHSDPRASYGFILAGLHVGIGVGALLTHFIEVSAGRAVVVDLFGLLGALVGASVGIPIIFENQDPGNLRAYAGILLGTAAAGLGIGILATRRWDHARRQGRDRRRRRTRRGGELSFSPAPMMIPPVDSRPTSRPALGINLLGGTW